MAAFKHVRRDDVVVVLAGKAKGKSGRILRVDTAKQRVFVEGLNMIKRHQRPTPGGDPGGVVEREGPIHVSNVALLDPSDNRPTRARIVRDNGERRRVGARTGADL